MHMAEWKKNKTSSLEWVKPPELEMPISFLKCSCLCVLRSVQGLKGLNVLYLASIVLHNILVLIVFLLDLLTFLVKLYFIPGKISLVKRIWAG